MARLPRNVSGKQLAKALDKLGYQVARQSGSHASLRAPGRPVLTIPMHKELRAGTLRAICRQAGLTVDELADLLT